MPELPEVETVKETLKRKLVGNKITDVQALYPSIVASPSISEFQKRIIGQTIHDMKRRGKWLIFILDQDALISHLRMEGKYFFRTKEDAITKHEHVIFTLDQKIELRYQDTRKFGRMYLVKKEELNTTKPLNELGLEPWDDTLTVSYLRTCYQKKTLPIKTVLLDQSIITGIGNIYADEILYLCKLNPMKKAKELTDDDLKQIIHYTKEVLELAIKAGGTTIRSYTSSEGVTGRFQHELYVHGKEGELCKHCYTTILKTKVGGRGTYYCPTCQK